MSRVGRAFLGALLCLALLTACAPAAKPPSGKPLVLATFTVLADIARVVGGDAVRVESIMKPGAEVHGYEPTPGDFRASREARLILDNGLGLEAWFEKFLAESTVPRVVVSDGIDPIAIAGSQAPNPHAWMSPRVAEQYVDQVEAALVELAPGESDVIRANASDYRTQIRVLGERFTSQLASVPAAKRVLVSCEGAFSYLARDFGLTEAAIWPVNSEQQVRPRDVSAVIGLVRERDVPAVFCESTVSDAAMRRVSEATGAAWGGTLYVDSLSEAGGPVPSYLELLRYDTELIASALNGSAERGTG